MFHLLKTILVRACPALALVLSLGPLLAGCGQKGDLYLPTGAEAAGRASLPQTLIPGPTRGPATATTASPASTTAPTPSPSPVKPPEPGQ